MLSFIRSWFPQVVIITALCGLVYITGQQNLRMAANDPQIQLSEDLANRLAGGSNPSALFKGTKIDIEKSIAPYIIVFNDQGKPVASNARLGRQIPTIPQGIFQYTKEHSQDTVTWQPKPEVRSAIVVTAYQGNHPGFVLAGRSLRETEIREGKLLMYVTFVWLVTISATFVISALLNPKKRTK